MGAQHTVLTTPNPPIPVDNLELAGYIQDLRRRVEVLNIQIEGLVIQVARKDQEIDRLSLDLGIRRGDLGPGWQQVQA
jgi:hypothetical protein